MDETLRQELKALPDAGSVVERLAEHLARHPADAEALYMRGNAYRSLDRWREAMTDYLAALDLDPHSPARLAYESVQQVLTYRCTDLYNP